MSSIKNIQLAVPRDDREIALFQLRGGELSQGKLAPTALFEAIELTYSPATSGSQQDNNGVVLPPQNEGPSTRNWKVGVILRPEVHG